MGEAQLSGTVVGRQINFIKRYLISSPDPVTYIGTISEDENYIQGYWNIGLIFSGEWEAHRSGDNLIVRQEIRQTVDISI